MKEKIYTIPVNEAFEQDCECPMCFLKNKLECEAVEYSLGAAMMEPDYRIVSNEKGYCNRHYSQLFEKPNKLSLSLVMDTHMEEVRKKLLEAGSMISSFENEKSGLFRKKNSSVLDEFLNKIDAITNSCVICDELEKTLDRFTGVVFYLWEKEPDFKKRFMNSKGLCLPHLKLLIKASFRHMSRKNATEFSKIIFDKEQKELERIQSEIHKFTLKFDYRHKDEKWGTEKDAPVRTLEKLSGYIHKPNNK